MTTRMSRLLVGLYPRSWRRRYGCELAALLEASRPNTRLLLDIAGAAGRERLRALARVRKGPDMARSAVLLAAAGALFVYVSTMTAVHPTAWLLLNGAFAVSVACVAFVRARYHGWLDGFGAAAIGSAAFVAMLITWIAVARESLVQLPFDHFDVERRGSPEAYLAGSGFSEFAWASLAGLAVALVVLALIAQAGAMSRRATPLVQMD
jgi:hypothetical protein